MKKALEEGSRGAFPQAFGVVLGGNETVTRGESPDLIGQSLPPLQLEFAVQMTCQSCVDAVRKSLQGVAGIQGVEVQLENQTVLLQTTLPSQEVQALLEGTGRQAVLKGMGSDLLRE